MVTSKTTATRGRWRRGLEIARAMTDPAAPAREERMSFTAEIPAGAAGPVCRINVQVVSEPHGDGERLRLRAHLQTNLASVLRPAMSGPGPVQPVSDGRALTPVQRAGGLARRSLQRMLLAPVVQRLSEPLLRHDFNTWVELQASSASLDEGAHALLPQPEKLAALGIKPSVEKSEGPVAESWSGQSAGGYAQLSLLQIHKKHLPWQWRAWLGEQPFQIAVAIANTVDRR